MCDHFLQEDFEQPKSRGTSTDLLLRDEVGEPTDSPIHERLVSVTQTDAMTTESEERQELEATVEELRVLAAAALEWKRSREEPIDVEELRAQIDEDFAFDFDRYLSFLEASDCLDFDRDDGRIELHEAIVRAVKTPDDWKAHVDASFGAEGADASDLPHPKMTDAEPHDDEVEPQTPEVSPQETVTPTGGESLASGVPPGVGDESDVEATTPEDSESSDDAGREADEPDSTGTSSNRESSDEEHTMNAEAPEIPDHDRYEFSGEIGSGGFGTVYRGRDTKLQRDVAIKRIRNIFDVFAQLDRSDVVARYRELTRAQARLSHPAVVQVYDVETETEHPFAVTEYASMGNLRQLVDEEENRTLAAALEYFVQILYGVHAAHEDDLVHGNIKPENVVLDEAGNAKLSDFGLTRLVELDDAETEDIYVGVGAVEYKAPEQIQDDERGSPRSDIYSLGVMFYEMLTGDIPSRRSPMPSEIHDEIPPEIDDIFDRMSLDDPDDRYQSVEAILADIYGSEEIVDAMDRRTGVVHLANPLDEERRPEVDRDAHLRSSAAAKRPATREKSGDPRTPEPEASAGGDADSSEPTSGEDDVGESPGADAASKSETDAATSAESETEASGEGDGAGRDDAGSDEIEHEESSWSLF